MDQYVSQCANGPTTSIAETSILRIRLSHKLVLIYPEKVATSAPVTHLNLLNSVLVARSDAYSVT